MRYLQRVMEGNVALLHPKEELGMLADVEKVKYVVEKVEEVEQGGGRLSCGVWVGKREIVKVGGGISVIEVETRGAEEAGRILKAERAKRAEKENPGGQEAEQGPVMLEPDDKMDETYESDGDSMAYETANEEFHAVQCDE